MSPLSSTAGAHCSANLLFRVNVVRAEDRWETRSTNTPFEDPFIAVVVESVQTPARSEPTRWTTIRRKPAVVIGALTVDGKLVLIREERIPVRATLWSVPAGQIDERDPDEEEIKATALRELREETGYQLAARGELIALGDFFTSPGFTDEHAWFFLARPVELVAEREPDQSIVDCRAFSPRELRDMIARNEIRDSNTLSICARMAAQGLFSFAAE
jgi:ADP-ribose pyrophosphatase